MWQGHASLNGRLGGIYVARGSLGWQIMGPWVSGPRYDSWGGNAFV